MKLRALRRDRAARRGAELFLYERAFDDCLERIESHRRHFSRALLIGVPDAAWPRRVAAIADSVEARDPGPSFASAAGGETIIEDSWQPPEGSFDLVVTIGTLDTVNELPLALRLIRLAMAPSGLFIGAMSGGDTLPRLRGAMRAADAIAGVAAPHVHPRIEAAALAPLLEQVGFVRPVVDVDRVPVSYRALAALVADLRAMAATNLLLGRPGFVAKAALAAAERQFREGGDGERTVETFEILHFAAWIPNDG